MNSHHHPKALPYLFLTEMWERFGFYVVQGMLVLYMTKAFGMSDDLSYTISGAFTALAYIMPMIGGIIADRILGYKTSIVWGGFFLSAGYALLAMPNLPHSIIPISLFESSNFYSLYLALAIIVIGNGLFKPNISSLLGALYAPGDTARDTGFTIFYIGINIGAVLAGFSSGRIQDHFGWHAGFAIASVGLLLGLCIFALGIMFGNITETTRFSAVNKHAMLRKPWIFLYCLAATILISLLLQSSVVSNYLLPMVGIILILFIFIMAMKEEGKDRRHFILLNCLIISSIVFWMLFLQIFFAANVFVDRLVDKHFFGYAVPTSQFYAFESLFVILLGPFFAMSWQILNRSNNNPSAFSKFVLAMAFAGFGFLTLVISTYFPDADSLISPYWIVLSYFFITIGELLLSPIGLSAVTLLSPSRLTGLMMGIWFVALGFGGEFAGLLAKLSSIPDSATTAALQLPIYRNAFLDFTYIAFGVTVLLFILQRLLLKNLGTAKS